MGMGRAAYHWSAVAVWVVVGMVMAETIGGIELPAWLSLLDFVCSTTLVCSTTRVRIVKTATLVHEVEP